MSTQNVAMIDCCFWSISFLHAGEVTLSGRLLATASICQVQLLPYQAQTVLNDAYVLFFLVMQSLELALHSKQGAIDISLSWMLYALQ